MSQVLGKLGVACRKYFTAYFSIRKEIRPKLRYFNETNLVKVK